MHRKDTMQRNYLKSSYFAYSHSLIISQPLAFLRRSVEWLGLPGEVRRSCNLFATQLAECTMCHSMPFHAIQTLASKNNVVKLTASASMHTQTDNMLLFASVCFIVLFVIRS